ncbi:MAG: hypothetical protein JXQ73_22145 [Phycisphaerae bacterium]|nr:hypothetical protein [Phycisphaerae bacterium]
MRKLVSAWGVAGVACCGLACLPHAGTEPDNSTARPSTGSTGIGRPVSFGIALTQGARELLRAEATIDPNDPLGGKSPRYYKIVDDYGYFDGASNASVYLTVSLSGSDMEMANIQIAVRSAKSSDVRKKANNPLFMLSRTESVSFRIEALRFERDGAPRSVSVFHYPYGAGAAGASMLYYGEWDSGYYRLPGAVLFDLGAGNKTLQVPQSVFMDNDAAYWFEEDSGVAPSVEWARMTSPSPTPDGEFPALRTNGTETTRQGDVFELSVCAVVWFVGEGD